MKIVPFNEDWRKDHPLGTIAFHHMLKGEPDSSDNFMFILGRQDEDFYMPRHRHNFDQIRFPLRGRANHGDGIVVGEGEIAYIPEGLPYGPQEDPIAPYAPGERMQVVLQFGGASGCGFMSIEQRRQAIQELSKTGTFDGNYYRRNDGSSAWGLNAIWEYVFGTRIKYPRPRYKSIIMADPKRFNWLRVAGATGVDHKFMGAFSERGVWVEMVRLQPNATWTSSDLRAKRLLFVLGGEGTIGEHTVGTFFAIQIDPSETLALTARSEMELFLIGLPPVEVPAIESDQYDHEELPAEPAMAT
jgi:hypothetical protein